MTLHEDISTPPSGVTELPARVSKFLARDHKLLIGGEWVDAADGTTFETLDPATGEVLARVPAGGKADIDRAVAAARRARL